MEKLDLRQTIQTGPKKTKASGKSQTTDLPENAKVSKLDRRGRRQRSKSSVPSMSVRKYISRDAQVPTSKESEETTSERPSYRQVMATENRGPPSTIPELKLQAEVRKLKKALEAHDKKKRASQTRLSRMKASTVLPSIKASRVLTRMKVSKDQTGNLARKVLSASDIPEHVPQRLASKGVGEVKDSLLSATALTKNALVNRAAVSRRKTVTSKKSDQTPSRLPRRTGSAQNAVIETINASALEISGNFPCVMVLIQNLIMTAVEVDQPPVPSLSFGLERVLFNPGVYHLQDPRSRVYNFDPYLEKIMPVSEFDFSALKAYITSSGDETLKEIARSNGKRYIGSSSSMTSVLAHFHYLLSQWREIGTSMLSNKFPKSASKLFTAVQKAPTAVFLRWQDGTYAIDADKQFATANILMMLGKSMEKLLTLEKDGFERYRKSSETAVPLEERNAPESYHYSTMGDFLMRSQLDAHDARLPGSGMFDLKTRAVVSVRMDYQEFEKGMGYEIKNRLGEWESYEREYYDMIRSTMLKYSLQVRMGRMDGIFVAYHNTQRIFGFQYISLGEMDAALHGQWDTTLGDQEFKVSLDLLDKVLDRATKKYPEQSLRIHFETREAQTPFMYIFAEPVTETQIQEIQSENDAEIAAYEREILGLHDDSKRVPQQDEDGKWANLQADVEKEMEKDEVSMSSPLADSSVGSEAFESDHPEVHGLQAANKGPPRNKPQSQSDKGEQVSPTPDGVDLDGEHGKDLELSNESDEGGLIEGRLESQETPEIFRTHDVSIHEEAEEMTAGVSVSEKGRNIVHGGETLCEAANGTYLEEPTEGNKGEISGDAVNADAEQSTEQGTGDSGRDMQQNRRNDSSDREPQSSVPENKDLLLAAEVPSEDPRARAPATVPPSKEVLAMTLTIRNKVNGCYVHRPENLSSQDGWSVEYAMAEVGDSGKAWNLYQASQARRAKASDRGDDDDENKQVSWFISNLRELSKKGHEWREKQNEMDRERPRYILGHSSAKGERYDVEDSETDG
ncbi:MAG: hypothetical protein Q9195_001550 [Heterodermia aff. obscurata]